jgi:hypothetical protein
MRAVYFSGPGPIVVMSEAQCERLDYFIAVRGELHRADVIRYCIGELARIGSFDIDESIFRYGVHDWSADYDPGRPGLANK